MPDLSVRYMGMDLRNPIIVSSSGLTERPDKVKRCADAGAGAVVLKSLFEEQIIAKTADLEAASGSFHTEAADYLGVMTSEMNLAEYLDKVEKAKKSVDIPVIASVNCNAPGSWFDFAKRVESAGADALELNTFIFQYDTHTSSADIEKRYVDIVRGVKEHVSIPVSIKIGDAFTSLAYLVDQLAAHGAAAVVLFNRYYRINMDIETFSLRPDKVFSTPDEITHSLRWISVLAGRVNCDLAATTGIHDGKAVIKQIMAGAAATQVCSVLYQKGVDYIGEMLAEIESWLSAHDFAGLGKVQGLMSQKHSDSPESYARFQFLRAYDGFA
jgi:dihydroorotate dehydrogenase (fumarate)